jgi:hypothetical protein
MKTTIPQTADPIMAAYRQGFTAYQQDRSRFTNPLGGAEWFAWDSGWQDARTAAEGEEED